MVVPRDRNIELSTARIGVRGGELRIHLGKRGRPSCAGQGIYLRKRLRKDVSFWVGRKIGIAGLTPVLDFGNRHLSCNFGPLVLTGSFSRERQRRRQGKNAKGDDEQCDDRLDEGKSPSCTCVSCSHTGNCRFNQSSGTLLRLGKDPGIGSLGQNLALVLGWSFACSIKGSN